MKNILTSEEKKYLRFISRMLQSYGHSYGYYEIDVDYSLDNLDYEDLNVKQLESFANNYSIDTPKDLYPILEKVIKEGLKYDETPDIDDVNYGRVEIFIDAKEEDISVKYFYTYYDTSDSSGMTYDAAEDDSVKQVLETLSELGIVEDELTYDGSGDSGYISDRFSDSNKEVPADVEDFCYRQLEGHFGGWEINEGSQGNFHFNTRRGIIELSHTYNEEIAEAITLYQESFSK
jgi:hypothetical protein